MNMIDLHCHILPGTDDGPVSADESMDMGRLAVSDGISAIITTPHTLNGMYRNLFPDIQARTEDLQRMFTEQLIGITLYPGAEEHFRPGLTQRILSGESSTLNHTGRYVLVEFPFHTVPPGVKDEFLQLKLEGIIPVIAHPERNTVFQQHVELLVDLISEGAITQITAMSITGDLGLEARNCSHRFLENRIAHVIASDAHSSDYRTPVLSQAVTIAGELLGDPSEAMAMVRERPQAILDGLPVQIPAVIMKKKWWLSG